MQTIQLHETLSLAHLDVLYHDRLVGALASPKSSDAVYFQYAPEWLRDGFPISPLSMPLENRLFESPKRMFAIFCDSLPGDWGKLLTDRAIEALGYDSAQLSELARLSLLSENALGALEYNPRTELPQKDTPLALDDVARACQVLFDSGQTNEMLKLLHLAGSSGGARPKIMMDIDQAPWIVKFPNSIDGMNSGFEEYRLSQLAAACGIAMAETRLLPSQSCAGFFATRRFDRRVQPNGSLEKIHMVSAAALLEVSPFDVVDYRDLIRLTFLLTHDIQDVKQLYRVMCFNVFVGNCDDHSKNFSFLYDEAHGAWGLSPAYDLTRNDGFLGEHATLVNGKGSNICIDDLVAVGKATSLTSKECQSIAREIQDIASDFRE